MALDTASPFVWGAGGAQMTPEQIAAQRKVAQAMIERGTDYSPVQSGWQGASRVAQALMGGLESREADQASKSNSDAEAKLLSSVFGGATPAAAATPTAAPSVSSPMGNTAIPAGKDEFVNSIMPMAQEASAKTGIDPRVIVAQAALESGWGKSAPGNNLFGIKSHGQPGGNTLPTTEVVNGQPVQTTDSFRAYASPKDSVSGYADFMNNNPRYAPMRGAQGLDAQVAALGKSGYATDPAYGDKVGSIARSLPAPAAVSAGPAAAAEAPQPPTAAAPQAAPATPQAAASGANPRLLQAMASPYISDGTKRVLGLMLQKQMDQDKVSNVDLGNKVGILDARGNLVRTLDKGEPNKGPSFVDGPPDPATGLPTKVWVDPRDKSVTPYALPSNPNAAPSSIPQAPAGVDPKVWREAQSKAAAANGLPATFDDTSKLRGEFTGLPAYKNMAQAAPIYQSMADAAGRNTKAADLNMVYGLGKIMDPGSVVREGEIQMANNAQGWQEKLNGVIAQINNEGGLTPQGRQALMAEAYSRITAYKQQYDADRSRFEGIAGRNRINPADVVPDFGEFKPWEAPKPVAPTSPPAIPPAAAPQAAPQPAPTIDPSALAEARRRGLIK